MKNFKLLSFLFLIFPSLLYGQYSGFDLSKYKLPDIKTDRLDVNFNISTAVRNSESTSGAGSKYYTNNFNGSINLDYSHFRNTEKYQGIADARGYLRTGPYKYESAVSKVSSDDIEGQFIITTVNRFYNQKLNFIEVDPGLTVNSNDNKYHSVYVINDDTRDERHDQFSSGISIPFSIGHGRIEPVEDLRLAIYILEELNKAGRINNMPPENVVIEMAREISRIKKRRFFDSRIKKINELQAVDSFLLANKIVSQNDITYFALLNDQWDYASGPARYSGFLVSAGIDDNINLARSIDKITATGMVSSPENKSYVNTYYVAGMIRIMYAKPLNLYWQTSATFETSYGYEFTRNPKEMNDPAWNYRSDILNPSLSYLIQYLPNSRTSVGLTLTGDYKNSKRKGIPAETETAGQMMKDNQFTIYTGFDMYYYISPRLRLQMKYNLVDFRLIREYYNYAYPDNKSRNEDFDSDLSLSLVYSFF